MGTIFNTGYEKQVMDLCFKGVSFRDTSTFKEKMNEKIWAIPIDEFCYELGDTFSDHSNTEITDHYALPMMTLVNKACEDGAVAYEITEENLDEVMKLAFEIEKKYGTDAVCFSPNILINNKKDVIDAYLSAFKNGISDISLKKAKENLPALVDE